MSDITLNASREMPRYLDLKRRGYAVAWSGEGVVCLRPTKLSTMLDTVQPGGKELTFDFDDWKREDIERVLEIVAYRGLHGAFDGRFLLVRDLTGIEAAPCANSSTT